MSQNVDFLGQTRIIPETPETDWGEEMTEWCVDVSNALDPLVLRDGSDNIFPRIGSASVTLADDSTLTPTAPLMLVDGDGGPVTLNVVAIADGFLDGQVVQVTGTDSTNTVTILHGSNTILNGHVTLAQYDSIVLRWSLADSAWVETGRSS